MSEPKRPVHFGDKSDRELLLRLFGASCASDWQSFAEGFAAGQGHVMQLIRQLPEDARQDRDAPSGPRKGHHD